MGKKSRAAAAARVASAAAATPAQDVPVVGPREPCPCGSGKRYKACHGKAAARAADQYVSRPFAGLASECDWVALREIVPAATAPLTLRGEHVGRAATVATVLPMAYPALVRDSGEVLLGLQVATGSGDASRDLAEALVRALAAEPGTSVDSFGLPGQGPRLQDLLDPAAPLEVTVHDGFDFWVEGADPDAPEVAASLERANAAMVPTVRLASVEAGYWCQMRERNHLRWVLPHDEEPLLDAMARLHAAGADGLGEGTRFIGSFRTHGLLVPVWDLLSGTSAEQVEEPAAAYGHRLEDTLGDSRPLSAAERRARAGLLSRQLTIR
jgi:hypothetical protein